MKWLHECSCDSSQILLVSWPCLHNELKNRSTLLKLWHNLKGFSRHMQCYGSSCATCLSVPRICCSIFPASQLYSTLIACFLQVHTWRFCKLAPSPPQSKYITQTLQKPFNGQEHQKCFTTQTALQAILPDVQGDKGGSSSSWSHCSWKKKLKNTRTLFWGGGSIPLLAYFRLSSGLGT